jgi:hypothetical protein
METLQVGAVIFIAIWFGAMGSNRSRPIMVPLWALLGVVIWVVGFYGGAIITTQLLLTAGSAIAANGVDVLSRLVGISVGIGLCYLFYRLRLRPEPAVTSA